MLYILLYVASSTVKKVDIISLKHFYSIMLYIFKYKIERRKMCVINTQSRSRFFITYLQSYTYPATRGMVGSNNVDKE